MDKPNKLLLEDLMIMIKLRSKKGFFSKPPCILVAGSHCKNFYIRFWKIKFVQKFNLKIWFEVCLNGRNDRKSYIKKNRIRQSCQTYAWKWGIKYFILLKFLMIFWWVWWFLNWANLNIKAKDMWLILTLKLWPKWKASMKCKFSLI